MSLIVDIKNAPRGIRNNNPGNIEFNPRNKWKGLNPNSQKIDKRFCVFITPEWGIRALMRLIRNYKLETINKIINRWAPSFENDTSAYAQHVAKVVGVGVNDKIDCYNKTTLINITKGIIIHENGFNPYPEEVIESAYLLI